MSSVSRIIYITLSLGMFGVCGYMIYRAVHYSQWPALQSVCEIISLGSSLGATRDEYGDVVVIHDSLVELFGEGLQTTCPVSVDCLQFQYSNSVLVCNKEYSAPWSVDCWTNVEGSKVSCTSDGIPVDEINSIAGAAISGLLALFLLGLALVSYKKDQLRGRVHPYLAAGGQPAYPMYYGGAQPAYPNNPNYVGAAQPVYATNMNNGGGGQAAYPANMNY